MGGLGGSVTGTGGSVTGTGGTATGSGGSVTGLGGSVTGTGGTGSGGSGSGGTGTGGSPIVCTSPLGPNFSLTTTTVSGKITVNGAAISTASGAGSGSLSLGNSAGDSAVLGLTSGGTYSVLVAAGTYDLYYSNQTLGSALPTNSRLKVRSSIAITQGTQTLDLDVPATSVTGKVTVNGAFVASGGYGTVTLVNAATDDSASLGTTGNASFSWLVGPGTYDVYYQGQNGVTAVPVNTSAKIQSGVVVGTGATMLNIDVPGTTVSGKVTVNGVSIGSASGKGVGTITLRTAAGDRAPLGTTGGSSYSALVVPGTYDVYFSETTRGTAVPVNKLTKLKSGVVVGSSPLTLNVDVAATAVSGTITVNGAAATSAAGVGTLFLQNAAGDSVGLGLTNASSYSALAVPGTYDLYYGLNLSGAGVPTNTSVRLRTGVVVGSTPLTLNVDVAAVTVSGAITLNGAPVASDGQVAITLRNAEGDSAQVGTTDASSYSALVVPGSYDVYYANTSGDLALPRNDDLKLQSGLVVGTSPLTLNVDLPSALVSGMVTVNGVVVSNETAGGVGAVVLETSAGDYVGLSATARPYSDLVAPGTYEAYYRFEGGGTQTQVPANTMLDLGCFVVSPQ